MDKIAEVLAWLSNGYEALVAIVQNNRFIDAASFFGLCLFCIVIAVSIVVYFAIGQVKHDRFKRQGNTESRDFEGQKIVLKGPQEGERYIALAGNLRGFKEGEVARLKLNFIGMEPAKKFTTVTIRRRRQSNKDRAKFDQGCIEVSLAAFNEFGIGTEDYDVDELVSHATLVKVWGIENALNATFKSPDQATRLAWMLSIYSFVASAIAGALTTVLFQ